MNIYDTYYLLAAVRAMRPEHTFFKRRYAPTDVNLDIFGTSKVLADYEDQAAKGAPFVLPRIGSVPVGREGFSTYELEPANISISMPLTIDQLTKRSFGEGLMSGMTPADRATKLQLEDLQKLNRRISHTEEWLTIATMLDNGCTMQHQTEREDVFEDVKVRFYDGDNNPALYTPASKWEHSTKDSNGNIIKGNWYKDICNMVRMLTRAGLPASDLLMSGDVAEFIIDDIWTQSVLDNRRMEMGRIAPEELTEYVTVHGTLNFGGRNLLLIESNGSFVDKSGQNVQYIPDGSVIVTAPACARGLYGAVTQMEEDKQLHTRAGSRVPRHLCDVRTSTRETELTARPLIVPKSKNPWAVAKSVFD